MIPKAYINEWRAIAPWISEAQIEQDLILSRAICEIFSEPTLAELLAFRGGTALHKLFIQPSARYSEDIDLVQIKAGGIGVILEKLRKQLDHWLGEPKWKLKEGRATFIYRFNSETYPITPMRLKVEINTREHFSVLGLLQKAHEVKSTWFSNKTLITTYTLEELLGTKLRALYQRKKGRDLFELQIALDQFPLLDISKLIVCFERYMEFVSKKISRAEFEENLHGKINDAVFIEDMKPLLPINLNLNYDPLSAFNLLHDKIISHLPGDPWKGKKQHDNN